MKDSPLFEVFTIGIIRKPHGVRGFFRVQSSSGEFSHFASLRELSLRGPAGKEKTFAIEECKISEQGIIMKVRGIDSPEEAALYNGWEIRAGREDACPLRAGEYYIAELCGCLVVCGGKTVGTVKSVIETGAHDMLEVVDAAGKTYMIPFAEAHVGEVDIAGRSIELKSEWLLQ